MHISTSTMIIHDLLCTCYASPSLHIPSRPFRLGGCRLGLATQRQLGTQPFRLPWRLQRRETHRTWAARDRQGPELPRQASIDWVNRLMWGKSTEKWNPRILLWVVPFKLRLTWSCWVIVCSCMMVSTLSVAPTCEPHHGNPKKYTCIIHICVCAFGHKMIAGSHIWIAEHLQKSMAYSII